MMWNDVVDLRDFYGSSLGQVVQRLMRLRLRQIWPNVRGMNVLGLGYATPYLRSFTDEAARAVAVMPAPQGVLHWPRPGSNAVALADECELPLPDRLFDRVLLVHTLECAEQVRPLLREVWRVMADGGRMIVVVPNRTGLWAQLERTPFAQGRPFSLGQINRVLRNNMFTPVQESFALYVPPVRSRMILGAAPAIERIGARLLPRLAGVVLLEASKQLYAGTLEASAEPARAARPRLRIAASRGGVERNTETD